MMRAIFACGLCCGFVIGVIYSTVVDMLFKRKLIILAIGLSLCACHHMGTPKAYSKTAPMTCQPNDNARLPQTSCKEAK